MKDKIMEGILFIAEKMQTNRYMTAIKNGFTALLPITICGAFCVLLMSVVCTPNAKGISLANFEMFAWLENLNPIFQAGNYATLNFMAIGLIVLIAIELGKTYDFQDNSLPLVALASYVTLCATTVTGTTDAGEAYTVANVIAQKFTNAQGLFMGMIVAILSTEIYIRLVKSGKMDIRLPESVPTNVAKAFNVLIPGVVTIVLISSLGFVFQMIFGYSFYDAITIWIQKPLTGVMTGLPGYLLLFFVSTVLWTLGIHGTQTLSAIYSAPMLLALTENMDAVANGLEPTNILSTGFVSAFTIITGAGLTGGLIIAILLFSKREDYRTIAKLSIAPGIFNINETMTFGLPIVLNPVLAIPFMIAPAVSATFAYFMTTIGFAHVICYQVPWTTPALLSAFLATGGHIGTVITQGICILLSVVIYTPFVMIANKQALEEAQG
ncbi:MAG: PTS transporter subunit EIIC [Erysipelotrichaceae bacterium]|nr:PTS transporter subunit EIIC [Erysipelotrichaceae bacterium]MDY5252952.1 PTS transporter subunit EIIC [Erysipelotrichaceae bacterium]